MLVLPDSNLTAALRLQTALENKTVFALTENRVGNLNPRVLSGCQVCLNEHTDLAEGPSLAKDHFEVSC